MLIVNNGNDAVFPDSSAVHKLLQTSLVKHSSCGGVHNRLLVLSFFLLFLHFIKCSIIRDQGFIRLHLSQLNLSFPFKTQNTLTTTRPVVDLIAALVELPTVVSTLTHCCFFMIQYSLVLFFFPFFKGKTRVRRKFFCETGVF